MKLTSCPRWGTAGHGRASAGQGSTAGHSPKPASKPGPSPAPAALPAPQGPAWLQCHPYPTPALVPSPRGDTQPTCSPWRGLFSHQPRWVLPGPHSPRAPQMGHFGVKLRAFGVLFCFLFCLALGAQMRASNPSLPCRERGDLVDP